MSRNGEGKWDQLRCLVCSQTYRSPRILPCLHSFCGDCLAIVMYDGPGGLKSICCPECALEHALPSGGVSGLPVNVYLRNMLDITAEERGQARTLSNGEAAGPARNQCDLCKKDVVVGAVAPLSHCDACRADLCPECVPLHRRNTGHSPKQSGQAEQQGGTGQDPLPEYFESVFCLFCHGHREQEARFFCETCRVSLCDLCVSPDHDRHACPRIEESSIRDITSSARVLKQAKSVMTNIQDSVRKLTHTLTSLKANNEKVALSVCSTIDTQMQALQEHKRSLLQQLDDVCSHKEDTLLNQIARNEVALEEIVTNYSKAANTVKTLLDAKESQSTPASSYKPQPLHALEVAITAYKDVKLIEDDYLRFCSGQSAGKHSGFEMMGRIDGVGPSPLHSRAHGPGLEECKVGHSAHFSVSVCDRHGQARALGGDLVSVNIQDPAGQKVPAEIKDESSGAYTVSYSPTFAGEHRVSVTIEERNISGSPFVVPVLSKESRKHSGVFHCCVFCSTGGDKNTPCGCGGIMPGGFSGCGHGHTGHPGNWHWSCCGQLLKASPCSNRN